MILPGAHMLACFVIHPLEKGVFETRYESVFEPAIRAAGLEPCRVERDALLAGPVAEIEAGVRSAAICVADLTVDNPYVWFALGFAMANGKECVVVCARSRQKFPFNIDPATLLIYDDGNAESNADLRELVAKKIASIISKQKRIGAVAKLAASVERVAGLASNELVALTVVGQNAANPGDAVSSYAIRRDMEQAGFTRVAMTLGLTALLDKDFLLVREEYDDWFGVMYKRYSLTPAGTEWLLTNLDKLVLAPPDEP